MTVSTDARLDRWDVAAELRGGAAAPHPFATPAWQRTWWEHCGAGRLLVLPVTVGGRVVAVAPLRDAGAGRLRFLGGDLTDYRGPLLAAGDAHDAAAGLLRTLDERVDGWQELELRNARPQDGFVAALAAAARDDGRAVARSGDEWTAVLPLPATWEAYRDGLGRHRRHELARKERRLAREHPNARVRTSAGDDLAADLASFFALHRQARGGKAGFMTARHEGFFRQIALAFAASGALRLDLLEVDGRPLAATFAVQDDATFYLYNMAYDPAAAAVAPGLVLLAQLVRRAIDDGLQRFDFLRGLERYKLDLGAAPQQLERVRVLA